MKIYDISQEVFTCAVFPGDPAPKKETICSIDKGDVCNLTAFSMCAHNGTHVDAPFHFLNNGKTVEQMELSKLIGYAYVVEHSGELTSEDAEKIFFEAKEKCEAASKKILIKGKAWISNEAADFFASQQIDLIGNESQTVGPEDAPMYAHKALLSKEIVLLEGIRLSQVSEGVYLLFSAPLSLLESDGAPVRAVLVEI